MTGWQKAIKYLAMVLAILLIAGIISGIAGILSLFTEMFSKNDASEKMKSYAVAQTVTNLDMEIGAADICITTGDKLSVSSNLKHLTVKTENGTLKIKEKDRFVRFGNTSKSRLVLYIPKGFSFNEAEISTDAGRLTVSDLTADKLSLELGAGKTEIENLVINSETEIESGAGQIDITSGILNNLDLDIGAGKLNLKAAIFGNSQISAGVGAANITLAGEKENYRIHINKGLGSASVDGESMSDGSVYGLGDNKIKIDGGVGSINVDFEKSGISD